jgi:hypothetical protein
MAPTQKPEEPLYLCRVENPEAGEVGPVEPAIPCEEPLGLRERMGADKEIRRAGRLPS